MASKDSASEWNLAARSGPVEPLGKTSLGPQAAWVSAEAYCFSVCVCVCVCVCGEHSSWRASKPQQRCGMCLPLPPIRTEQALFSTDTLKAPTLNLWSNLIHKKRYYSMHYKDTRIPLRQHPSSCLESIDSSRQS